MIQNLIVFVKESFQELKKVTWPTRKEILGSSAVVLVVSFIFMIIIALVDWIIRMGLGFFLK
jgi:preprotein translocase subunit SecE